MNCCDYDCNQGRNCPARATPLGGVAPSTGEGFWPALWKMRKRADPAEQVMEQALEALERLHYEQYTIQGERAIAALRTFLGKPKKTT